MKRHFSFIAIALLLAATLFALGAIIFGHQPVEAPAPAPEEPLLSEGESIYANGEYGFLLQYPGSAVVEETFIEDGYTPVLWRAGALTDTKGTPVVSIRTHRTASETSYPRYYTTLVRVGVSEDAKEVERCLKAANGEIALPDVIIGGVSFKAFSFGDAGMMRYLKSESYRVVQDGKCVALEKIAAGSSYKEETSPKDLSEEFLAEQFAALDTIIGSFRLVAPQPS